MPARVGYMKPASGQSQRVTGKGGGSAATPQAHPKGSGRIGSSAPRSPQKIRG